MTNHYCPVCHDDAFTYCFAHSITKQEITDKIIDNHPVYKLRGIDYFECTSPTHVTLVLFEEVF